MGGMIVQEITKLIGDRVNKLICFATGSIGDIPGRFETMDETREKLISFSLVSSIVSNLPGISPIDPVAKQISLLTLSPINFVIS